MLTWRLTDLVPRTSKDTLQSLLTCAFDNGLRSRAAALIDASRGPAQGQLSPVILALFTTVHYHGRLAWAGRCRDADCSSESRSRFDAHAASCKAKQRHRWLPASETIRESCSRGPRGCHVEECLRSHTVSTIETDELVDTASNQLVEKLWLG